MNESIAILIVQSLTIYLAVGAAFGCLFITVGVGRLDPAARDGSWGFRVLIWPGSVALWPLLAWRWINATGVPGEERNAHRRAAATRSVPK